MGRATKAIAKVASEASVEEAGFDAGKNSRGEYQYRCSGVDVEVKKLDRDTDQTGEEDLPRSIDVLLRGIVRNQRLDQVYRKANLQSLMP